MAACSRCRAPIRWAKRPGFKPHEKGAFLALEPKPDARGIYAIVDDRVVLWETSTPKDAPRYHAHEVFCEAAGQPRRKLEMT